jgi:hypothetical protein
MRSRAGDRKNRAGAGPKEVAAVGAKLTAEDLASEALTEPARRLFLEIQGYRRGIVFAPPLPGLIYHYTSPQGFRGIVESNKLWATHVGFLNDRSEIEHGCSVVREALLARRERGRSDLAREFFDLALTSFNLNAQLETYVTSFSENGDLLSQWQMYGDAAKGFSIGVPMATLADLGGAGIKYWVCRVIYQRAKQEEVINVITEMTLAGLRRLAAGSTRDAAAAWIRQCCKVFQDSVWMMLVLFKNPAFEAEREWRAIQVAAAELPRATKQRTAGGQLVPYVELDFEGAFARRAGPIPIHLVHHGALVDPGVLTEMRELLRTRGHEHVDVRASQIPLRR